MKLVNASDVSQTKAQVGQLVTSSNFRTDINVSGTISASDVATVKSKIGTAVPIPIEKAEVARESLHDLKR